MAIVLLGIWASPVHNGGAYGDGTAEGGVGFGCGAARRARRLSQLALSSGRAGASGQDYFVVRFWEDEFGDCTATGGQRCDRRPRAATLPRARSFRTL